MRRKRLIDIYDNPRLRGIFFDMFNDTQLNALLVDLDITTADVAHSMDFDYILNNSGLKSISLMLQYIVNGFVIDDSDSVVIYNDGRTVTWDYVLIQVDKDIINNIIKIRYLNKWQRLVDTLKSKYDFLSPYNIETSRVTTDKLRSNDTNSSKSNSSNDYTDNSVDGVYGYDSEESVNTNKSNGNGNNKTSGESKRESEYNRDINRNETVNRSGNTGNHTSQELIRQERETLKYQIIKEIYEDLDSILTRSKYI